MDKPKRQLTPEQLEKLAKAREKANEARRKNNEIKKFEKEQKKEEKHSRPYYGYDARIDPTTLNAVRNKFVDVSGLLIANKNLPKNKDKMNMTFKPLKAYGVIL
jgi:hypothetical protein